MAGGVLILLFALWLFVRTWWGHLPHTLTNAVIKPKAG